MARTPLLASLMAGVALFAACNGDEGQPGGVVLPVAEGGANESDAGSDAGADATSSSTKKANGDVCGQDDECESGHCFVGGKKQFCTIPCTSLNASTVCVAPLSPRCNNRGVCEKD